MKRRTILTPLLATVAGSALAFPTETASITPKDTTKVIDIEEVVIIATPKENNRLRKQPFETTTHLGNISVATRDAEQCRYFSKVTVQSGAQPVYP